MVSVVGEISCDYLSSFSEWIIPKDWKYTGTFKSVMNISSHFIALAFIFFPLYQQIYPTIRQYVQIHSAAVQGTHSTNEHTFILNKKNCIWWLSFSLFFLITNISQFYTEMNQRGTLIIILFHFTIAIHVFTVKVQVGVKHGVLSHSK